MLNKALLEKIEEKFGKKLQYPVDVEALSESIFEETKERLGLSTLKRMFGFVGQPVVPRASTMDIIANYCGYPSYDLMAKDMGQGTEISDFTPVDEVLASDLQEGSMLQLSWQPGRILILTFLGRDVRGDGWFIVNESINSKLLQGDKIKVSHFTKGFKMLASEVIRDGKHLEPYTAAKVGGLTSVEIIQ